MDSFLSMNFLQHGMFAPSSELHMKVLVSSNKKKRI
jgi:hypothetical protein